MNTTELISVVEHKRIAVYGAGFVATKFYDALVMRKLHENVDCFIVSQKKAGEKDLRGIKILSIDEFENSENVIVCIAVHDVIKNEIEETLDERGITNKIWIRPYLLDLALGEPVKRSVTLLVDDIVQQCFDYRIAMRYLAVENYYEKNNFGFEVYVKAMEACCNRETAKKRLDSFCRMIRNWEKTGYQTDSIILVNEKNEIIDGAHRITLARYFRTDAVTCDVYPSSSDYSGWLGGEVLLSRDKVEKCGFTGKELDMLEDAYQRIRE